MARGERDEPRAIESQAHRYFVATLFQPQLSSEPGKPHPIIVAFLRAAAKSWQWTIDHPEEATKLTVEKYGVSGLDPKAVSGEIVM